MSSSDPESAAIACIEAFTERFNARDPAGMDATLHFPHLILADEHLVIWKAPGQLAPGYFEGLEAEGWARSTYHGKQVVLAGATKVHLLVEYSRDRANGSQISRHRNLWIVTLQDGRWGLKQRSTELSQVTLRTATLADAGAIRDLTRAAYAKWVAVIGREPKPMGADYEAAVRAHRFDLLDVWGELAALIETIDAGDHLLIENVAVSPAHQGRGLGRRLLAHAEEIAIGLGFDRVALYTNRRFEANVALYLRVGYGVDREEPIGDGVVVHMSKALKA